MIGVMDPCGFAEISYPTIEYRLNELPTYCIVDVYKSPKLSGLNNF